MNKNSSESSPVKRQYAPLPVKKKINRHLGV